MPGKNIAPIKGKPLVAYTIEAARDAKLLTRCVVSTDDEAIAQVARDWGADVPFMRPAALATDMALTFPVLVHALEHVEREENAIYDIVVLLQPTTPLRTSGDIDEGVRMLRDSDADSVVSIVDVGGNHPFRMKRLLDDGRLINYIDQGFEDMRPRQELPATYIRCGALYITRRDVMVKQERLVGDRCLGLVLPKERAVNIDEKTDLYVAERLLADRLQGPR